MLKMILEMDTAESLGTQSADSSRAVDPWRLRVRLIWEGRVSSLLLQIQGKSEWFKRVRLGLPSRYATTITKETHFKLIQLARRVDFGAWVLG